MDEEINSLPKNTKSDPLFEAAKKLLEDKSKILDNIMASMGDGLSIQDRNMRIVYQNKFIIDNFGHHVGEYCYNIYEKRDKPCQGCPIIKAYKTGQPTKALRVGITKTGVPFRFENIASVLKDDNGQIVAGVELCRIVEEREKAFDDLKKTTEILKKTQNQLVRSEKLAGIGQLAAGVAHEINNPAGFVLSNLNIMQEYVDEFFNYVGSLEHLIDYDSQDDSQKAKAIKQGVNKVLEDEEYSYLKNELPEVIKESLTGMKRIKNIVSSLMTFACSGEKQMSMIDTNAAIESALLLLENEINNKGSVVKMLSPLPKVYANPHQLEQMFVSMVLNATQAIKAGGVIKIKTFLKDNRVNIQIADNGVGIPKDKIKNIFNPFFTTREVGKGAGLGLSIAYRIIENHNGSINVKSELGKGTIFTIKLPLQSKKEVF